MAVVPDELRAQAARFPERVALRVVDAGPCSGELTFAEWDARSNAVARGLVAEGVARGDRVMLLLPVEATVRFAVSYFAAHKAGAIAVPVNPRLAPREIAHVRANCEPAGVVTGDDEQWARLVAHDTAPFQVAIVPGDVADIVYTSGSTGLPKGVAATHENVLVNAAAPMEREARVLHSIPMPTAFGSYGGLLLALRFGLTQVHLPRFDPARFAELIVAERPAWLLMVPAHALLLIESGVLAGLDTSSVRVLLYGSAPMPPHAILALAGAFPGAMQLNGYGLTEGGGSACTLPPGEALKRPGSVGKPVDGVTVRLVDEAGGEVVPGEVGEVTIHLAGGERRYWNDAESTARTWRDGWVHTGDLGYFDAEGFLYLVDRKKDLIIRGGYNVYSIEVEHAIAEHPDVAEVAVVGVPHAVLGQDVCAVVRLRAGVPPLELDALRAFVADRLADYKLPRRLVLRDEALPRSAMHKVDKKALVTELERSVPEPPS